MGRPLLKPGAVQIAGVHDLEEARVVADAGVDLLGFPLRLGFHREDCTDAQAAAMVAALGARLQTVLITYLEEAQAVADLAARLGVGWVQLHGAIQPEEVASLRRCAPRLGLIRSLVLRGDDLAAAEAEMAAHARHVDAYLTDTFDPETGAEGATGKTHDWRLSRALADRSPHPLILAGGLTPHNVRAAIRRVRPAAVDAHMGVEGPDGRKDPERLARFVEEARAGFAEIGVTPTPPPSGPGGR